MKMKKYRLLLGICLCFLFSGLLVNATESEKTNGKEVIRVGFYERDGYFEKQAGKDLYGFGVEYLNTIAIYSDWEYEYIEGTREECVNWLENGEIDLLSPVYTDTELENAFLSSRIIGEDNCYIYKSSSNFDVNQDDYSMYKDCIVGVVKASGLEEKLLEYCENNNFRFDSIVTYTTLEEAKQELADGKIDLVATDSYVNVENMKVVSSFVSGMITFAASREDIIVELDKALDQIKLLNQGYTEELREKYFTYGSQKKVEYSNEEIEFLKQDLMYKIALCKEQYPISFINSEKEYCGIAPDILTTVKYYTGIDFEYEYVDSYSQGKALLESGAVDILAGTIVEKQDIDSINYAATGEYVVGFVAQDMAFIGRKGTNLSDNLKVAVSDYLEKGVLYLEEQYPQYEFILYENDETCYDAIINHEVDLSVQSDNKINELGVYDEYKEIQKLKNIPVNFEAAFMVKTENVILVDILNKTLSSLSEAAVSNIVNNNMEYLENRGITVEEFLQIYLGDIIIVLVVICALIIGLVMYSKFKKEQKSKEKAYTDSLTGLSSVEKFRIDVEPILESKDKERFYAIALDIDKFKVINDIYGYDHGDNVIAYIGRVCNEWLTEGDYITRLGADNFMIFKKTKDIHDVYAYLNRVFERVSKDIGERDAHFRLILKAGIYKIHREDTVLSHVFDKASLAKKNMKMGHESSYNEYSEDMRRKNIEDKLVENDMEEALNSRQFQIYLQPQIDLITKKIVSAEALVRWMHPEKGMIPPFQFIPVFENNGFITRLDLYVWEEAIRTISEWKKQSKIAVPIAINLSRIDMEREGIIESLCDLMKKYNLDSEWIKTELTESIYLEDEKRILEQMGKLKKFGFKIAVDDFGSGYSSLHLLKSMPVDILKIDKSFLEISPDMQYREEILLRDVVEMGKNLGLQIIMEGVETIEQSDFLEAIGCDVVQGYYYGKPMPVEEFEKALQASYESGGSLV